MNDIYSESPPITVQHEVDMPDPDVQLELQGAILYSLHRSVIWLNGYHCIRPTDEFLKDLGATVLALLNNPANCLPGLDMQAEEKTDITKAQHDATSLYLRLMKS